MIKKIGKSVWQGFYFLLLLPLFSFLHAYSQHFPFIPLGDTLVLVLQYTGIIALLYGLLFIFLRHHAATAVLTFLFMCLQLFFGPAHDFAKSIFPGAFLVRYSFILPAVLAALILLLVYFKKKKPSFPRFRAYLNVLLLLLVLIECGQIIVKHAERPPQKGGLPPGFVACDTCATPDIYLIIADEYSGQKALIDNFGFDNNPFLDQLRQRGFLVVDSSISSYNYTPYTMASMFGMQYLEGIRGINKDLGDRRICFEHINFNPVIAFLKSKGYTFVNNAIFQFDNKLPYQSTSFYKTGKDLATAQTFLSRLDTDIRFNLVTRFRIRSEIRNSIMYEHDLIRLLYDKSMETISQPSSGPRFVYTHLEMPHFPYYYNREGKLYPPEQLGDEVQFDRKRYVDYLQYANGQYLQLIDAILANSARPPIIMFMSDHAFRYYPDDAMRRKYSYYNLNAVLFPDRNYKGYYKGFHTVNQFRVMLNNQFGQSLPMLRDSTGYVID